MAAMKEPESMSMLDKVLLGLGLILGLFALALIALTMR
jgi:hypothetical protein